MDKSLEPPLVVHFSLCFKLIVIVHFKQPFRVKSLEVVVSIKKMHRFSLIKHRWIYLEGKQRNNAPLSARSFNHLSRIVLFLSKISLTFHHIIVVVTVKLNLFNNELRQFSNGPEGTCSSNLFDYVISRFQMAMKWLAKASKIIKIDYHLYLSIQLQFQSCSLFRLRIKQKKRWEEEAKERNDNVRR